MQKILIQNRKARYDFEILETFEAGIVLLGHEVKSLKNGHGHFAGSFVTIDGHDEAWLKGMNIKLYEKATLASYDPERVRKLLLNKKEIQKIASMLNTKGVTLIPLSCGLNNGRVKLEIAVCRGKKNYDKRESIKKREIDRRVRQEI